MPHCGPRTRLTQPHSLRRVVPSHCAPARGCAVIAIASAIVLGAVLILTSLGATSQAPAVTLLVDEAEAASFSSLSLPLQAVWQHLAFSHLGNNDPASDTEGGPKNSDPTILAFARGYASLAKTGVPTPHGKKQTPTPPDAPMLEMSKKVRVARTSPPTPSPTQASPL
jgi:hypothetical protein